MKKCIALLLVNLCIFAHENDKNKDKDNNKNGYDCQRHLERRGFSSSEAKWLCDHKKDTKSSGGNTGSGSSSRHEHKEKRN